MALTQQDLTLQLIGQLRRLDPAASAEVGTPERLLMETFSRALSDNQIDIIALGQQLDIDSKFGSALDRFFALFRFGRQDAIAATGFVRFYRNSPALADTRIPAGISVTVPFGGLDIDATQVPFSTTVAAVIPTGATEVQVPVRCALPGTIGNVASGTITEIVGQTVPGVTGVINDVACTGGIDREDDDAYKTRFKNTVFRNLAGTRDQYLALAISQPFSTRATVLGPQSLYREYLQVPPYDDATSYDVDNLDLDDNPLTGGEAGGGNANEYTTALSTIPYAKHIWDNVPSFVSNGQIGLDSIFWRPDVDFRFNIDPTAKNRGDAKRFYAAFGSLPNSPYLNPLTATNVPNITLINVFTGIDGTVEAIRPGDLVLLEYYYLSEASRNDTDLNFLNAVDVYIDGEQQAVASTVTTRPSTTAAFIDNATSKYHYENYRRIGLPDKRPILGNILLPLFWQPVLDLPEEIVVGNNTYTKDIHYWSVEDVSSVGHTTHSRSGIEWSMDVKGDASDPDDAKYITEQPSNTPLAINEYVYDRNLVELQGNFDSSKQVCTDALAHTATFRFFKFDITLMYEQNSIGATPINAAISAAVADLLNSRYFGEVVQLSDILQAIHNSIGVDNVRWSSDVPGGVDLARAYECDVTGRPLLGVTTDEFRTGSTTASPLGVRPEIQALYIGGQPTAGTFTLTSDTDTTANIAYNASAAAIQSALNTMFGSSVVTVVEDTRSTTGVRNPIRSFRITWGSNGPQPLLVPNSALRGGPTVFYNDFILRDNELPALPQLAYAPTLGIGDSAPGFIIRQRAQNTWIRS